MAYVELKGRRKDIMKALFSQRQGHRPMKKVLQRESMDDDLRNRLWSGLNLSVWKYWHLGSQKTIEAKEVMRIAHILWVDYLKLPIDTMPERFNLHESPLDIRQKRTIIGIIREHFFQGDWSMPYDLIEYLLMEIPEKWGKDLKTILNRYLEEENSAYRIIGDEVAEITDNIEIQSIETALEIGIKESRMHISQAIKLISDRESPDYPNSIKESISAVEAAARVLTGKPKATLGECIKIIKRNGNMHPAFESALNNLYGYTSDAEGIRHAASVESDEPTYANAKFMLVVCSAFVNFIWLKIVELNIEITEIERK